MWETAMMRYKVAGECEYNLAMRLRPPLEDLARNLQRKMKHDALVQLFNSTIVSH